MDQLQKYIWYSVNPHFGALEMQKPDSTKIACTFAFQRVLERRGLSF
ncbi:hypothetical protein [Paenibacillus macerans]|nr:hypothetical protein [Paenibacillus macerans]MCM3701093.1 hypothetical protein [Paenibacillus macerans]